MAINLTQIQSNIGVIKNLILVTPGDAGYLPIQSIIDGKAVQLNDNKFVFNFEGEQKQILNADITDHFVEDNTALQDNIAIHPEEYSTQGYIGELTDILPEALQALQTVAYRLQLVPGFGPQLSVAALVALNRAVSLYNSAATAASTAKNTFNKILFGVDPQTKQQQAYNLFKNYMKNRTLFTIQTPWSQGANIMKNMAIKSLTAIQDPDTNSLSTFEITFKQMNFAQSSNIANNGYQGDLRFTAQSQTNPANYGSTTGTPTDVTPTSAVKGIK